MNTENYTASFLTAASSATCYRAATCNYDKWWTAPDRALKAVGDQAKFTFAPGQSYWAFEATRLEPNSHIEMTCVDALHIHEGQPKEIETEWLGTTLTWDFVPDGNQTRVTMVHAGLTPQLLCYDVCQAGWDFFFRDSLKAYLETGQGKPHTAPDRST